MASYKIARGRERPSTSPKRASNVLSDRQQNRQFLDRFDRHMDDEEDAPSALAQGGAANSGAAASVAAATADLSLPADTISELKEIAKKMAKDLDRQLRTSSKIKQIEALLEEIENGMSSTSVFHYPLVMVAFRPPPDAELLQPCNMSNQSTCVHSVDFLRGGELHACSVWRVSTMRTKFSNTKSTLE